MQKVTEKQLEITVPILNNIKLGWDQYKLAKYFRATPPVKMMYASPSSGAKETGGAGAATVPRIVPVPPAAPTKHDLFKHYLFDEKLAAQFPAAKAAFGRV